MALGEGRRAVEPRRVRRAGGRRIVGVVEAIASLLRAYVTLQRVRSFVRLFVSLAPLAHVRYLSIPGAIHEAPTAASNPRVDVSDPGHTAVPPAA